MASEAAAPTRHEGAGVARRAAFHERLRAERAELEAAAGAGLPPETDDVALVRAVDVLDGVAEAGQNYTLLKPTEKKKDRRKRLREAAIAAQAQGADRAVGTDDDVAAAEPEHQAAVASAVAGGGTPSQLRNGVRHSALANALEDEEDEEEAARGDGELLLATPGYDLSKQLVYVRRMLRAFLAEQAAAGKEVPMQKAAAGAHPTMRWTIKFGKWLATTRVKESKASRWHFDSQADTRAEEPTVRTGRGEDSVYVLLQHMKNHVWRELWPAMPADARQYWRLVTHHVMSLFDCGGGGMKKAAELVGKAAGRAAAAAAASAGAGATEQQAASEAASAAARKLTEAELRAGTTKPCAKEHLYQTGEYQMQDTQLSEPFEVNASFVLNAYMCFARVTGCRPGMAVNDAADAADVDGHWCAARGGDVAWKWWWRDGAVVRCGGGVAWR